MIDNDTIEMRLFLIYLAISTENRKATTRRSYSVGSEDKKDGPTRRKDVRITPPQTTSTRGNLKPVQTP
jgi:hypothetical protein